MDIPRAALMMERHGLRYTVEYSPFKSCDVKEWFHFASTLTGETREAFERHISRQGEVHTLHNHDDGTLRGFQMISPSRWFDVHDREKGRFVCGGKLRLHQSVRGIAFPHLCSIVNLSTEREVWGNFPLYRLSIANVFGFNSFYSHLNDQTSFMVREGCVAPHVVQAMELFARENGFDYDAQTGLVNVHFRVGAAMVKIAEDPAFQQRPAVRFFTSMCPRWADGVFLAWGWLLSDDQLDYVHSKSPSRRTS